MGIIKPLSLLSLSALALARPHSSSHHHAARSTPGSKHVIIQMFQWNWESIEAECAWIGANGYAYVQVSPPQESIQGNNWYDDYQAVSYKLTSKHGNQAQFASMVQTCKAHGVGVLIDLLWNDMSGIASGVGTAGSSFTQYNYPGVWDSSDFHYCGTANNAILDWSNAWQIQNCQLAGLADLKTESEKVRATLAAYANTLVGLGVAGFRVDASKHIPTTDLSNIMGRVHNKNSLYWTHEVVDEGSPINGPPYENLATYNDVQEFKYSTLICQAFTGGAQLSSFQEYNSLGWLPSNKANIFVVNHDLERSGCGSGILNYASPNNAYLLAQIFSLGFGYGTPTVFSGFSFPASNTGQDAPAGGYGSCSGSAGANGWNCEHRWTGIVGMVGLYKQASGASVMEWKNGASGQVAFARSGQAYVIINYSGAAWKTTFTTGLKDGTYCDVTKGAKSGNNCTGARITVSGGKINNYNVLAYSAVAIHAGAKL